MAKEQNQASVEGYSTKLVRHAMKRTWEFSKSQLIVSGVLAVVSVPVGYLFGLVTSVGSGILAALLVYIGAMVLVTLFNFLHAPAVIHREQEMELERLRQQIPATGTRQITASVPEPEVRPNVVCTAAGFAQVDIDDEDLIHPGYNHFAIIAEFVNQPTPRHSIRPVNSVFATITYFDSDNRRRQRLNHGT